MMKYRHVLSVLVEFVLLMLVAYTIGIIADFLLEFGNTVGIPTYEGFVYSVLCTIVFMIFALQRIQSITMGSIKLIYPAFAILCAYVGFKILVLSEPGSLDLLPFVLNFGIAFVGWFVAFILVIKTPWEKLPSWKRWHAYRKRHALPVSAGWLLWLYPAISTLLLWVGVDYKAFAAEIVWRDSLVLFQFPRQLLFESFVAAQLTVWNITLLYVVIAALLIFGILLVYLLLTDIRRKQIPSALQVAAFVYILCLVFAAPPIPQYPVDQMQWSVPVQNIERVYLHDRFSVFDRFAYYVWRFQDANIDEVRYRVSEDSFQFVREHAGIVSSITAIGNVYSFQFSVQKVEKPFRSNSDIPVLPEGFECAKLSQTHTQDTPWQMLCESVSYRGLNVFATPTNSPVYVRRIVTDSAGRFAVAHLDNGNFDEVERGRIFLFELPK